MTSAMLPVLLLLSAPPTPTPPPVREAAEGYSFERPADWTIEAFKGGFFLRSPQFGAGIIVGHVAKAPADAKALEALTVASVYGLVNVSSPRVTGKEADRVGGRDAFTVRFDGVAAGGQSLKALLTAVSMPNGRVLSVFLRAIPPERLPEWEAVHRRLLDSVRFDTREEPLDAHETHPGERRP